MRNSVNAFTLASLKILQWWCAQFRRFYELLRRPASISISCFSCYDFIASKLLLGVAWYPLPLLLFRMESWCASQIFSAAMYVCGLLPTGILSLAHPGHRYWLTGSLSSKSDAPDHSHHTDQGQNAFRHGILWFKMMIYFIVKRKFPRE